MHPRQRHVRRSHCARNDLLRRHPVIPHVRVVRVAQRSKRRRPLLRQRRPQLDLIVLRVRPQNIGVQVRPIRNLWHKGLGEARRPILVLILQHYARRVAARVRRIIPSAVVVHGPVHELQMAIAAHRVLIEVIRHREFADVHFQPAHWLFGLQGNRSAIDLHHLFTEPKRMADHRPPYIGKLAQRRIPHHIQVRRSR